MKSSAYYFPMKMNVLTDFPICIGVPLRVEKAKKPLTNFAKKLNYRQLFYWILNTSLTFSKVIHGHIPSY